MLTKNKENSPLISTQIQLNPVNQIINKLGFGKFQILNLFSISIIYFVQGSEITLLSILSFILQEEWNLSTLQTSFLGGCVLIGMSIGLLLCILLQKPIGRILILKISIWLTLLAGIISAFMVQIYTLSICRVFLGIGAGASFPATSALLAQCCPSYIRGRYMVLVEQAFMLGSIFVSLMAFWLVPDLEGGNWRWLIVIVTLPIIPSIFMIQFYSIESPLFLAETKQYAKAVENINIIAQRNGQPEIDENEVDDLYSVIPMSFQNQSGRWEMLVDKWHLSLTIKLLCIWVLTCYSYYGFMFIIPFFLDIDDNKETLVVFTLAVSFQFFFLLLVSWIIEKKTFGRKNSIIFFSIAVIFFSFFTLIQNEYARYIMVILLLSLQMMNFVILIPYTSELFETEIRILGFSCVNIVARIVTGFGNYFLLFLVNLDGIYVIVFVASMVLGQLIFTISLPFDTTGRELDSKGR